MPCQSSLIRLNVGVCGRGSAVNEIAWSIVVSGCSSWLNMRISGSIGSVNFRTTPCSVVHIPSPNRSKPFLRGVHGVTSTKMLSTHEVMIFRRGY